MVQKFVEWGEVPLYFSPLQFVLLYFDNGVNVITFYMPSDLVHTAFCNSWCNIKIYVSCDSCGVIFNTIFFATILCKTQC